MRYFYFVIEIIVTEIVYELKIGILSKHVDFELTPPSGKFVAFWLA